MTIDDIDNNEDSSDAGGGDEPIDNMEEDHDDPINDMEENHEDPEVNAEHNHDDLNDSHQDTIGEEQNAETT